MNDADYVVIRDPEEESINGRWYDLRHVAPLPGGPTGPLAVYTPTPFIETRDDGAVAQVYMRKAPAEEGLELLEREVARLVVRETLRYAGVVALAAYFLATGAFILAALL